MELLENRITSKLNNAGAKREDLAKSWLQRLSQTTRNKLGRGKRSLEAADRASKELEAKITIKDMSAEKRREELNKKKVEELTTLNESKVRRGQLAVELAEVEAKNLENIIEQKIVSANYRRDMKHLLTSARISESTAEKKEKAAGVRKRFDAITMKTANEINEKMALAEERKEDIMAKKVEKMATETNEKKRRGAEALNDQRRRAIEMIEESLKKVESATQRRENRIREQQQSLIESATKKERFATEKQKENERAARVMQRMIQSKLLSANARREEIVVSRVTKASESDQKKKERAKLAHYKTLDDVAQLDRETKAKMKKVALRKDRILKEIVTEMRDLNQSKVICFPTASFFALSRI